MRDLEDQKGFSVDDILLEIHARERAESEGEKNNDASSEEEPVFPDTLKYTAGIPASTTKPADSTPTEELKPKDDFVLHETAKTRRVENAAPAEEKKPLPLDGKVEDYFSDALKRQEKELLDREAFQTLKENRRKKIREFVLVGDEEDNDPEEERELYEEQEEDPIEEIDDYNSPEDAPAVAQDIKELKGSLVLRTAILSVAFALSFGLFMANALFADSLPGFLNAKNEPLVFAGINMVLLLFGAAFSYTTILGGLGSLVRLRPERDALPALAAVICIIQNAVYMAVPSALSDPNVHLLSPLALLGLLCNGIGKLFLVGRTSLNFKVVSSEYEKYGCHLVEEEGDAVGYTRGLLNDAPAVAANRKAGFLSDFLFYSYGEDLSDRISRLLTPISLIGAVVLAVVVQFMIGDFYTTLSAFTATICLCSPIGLLFAVHLPMRRAAGRLYRHGAAVLGYRAVEDYVDINAALTTASKLFPKGSVTLYGIKTFGEQRIDQAILDAASVAYRAGSILTDVFMQVINGKIGILSPVENLLYEDGMGVSAWVGNRRVLIGSRELMLNHGVDVPSRDYETRFLDDGKELVYLSTGGELSGVFIVGLSADPRVKAALKRQEQNDIFLSVKSVDPILDQNKLGALFDVEPLMFKIIPARLHEAYERETAPADKVSSPVVNNGSFYSYIRALVCAKRLKGAVMIGMVLQLASVVAGYALLSVFGVLRDFSQLTTLALTVYEAVWLVLTIIGAHLRGL